MLVYENIRNIYCVYMCICVGVYIYIFTHTYKLMITEIFLDGNIQHPPEELNGDVGKETKENVKL